MNILTVYYGGEWQFKEGECDYVGHNITTKALMIEDDIRLEDFKQKVFGRFNIKSDTAIRSMHLHPFLKLKSPYTLDSEDDFRSFMHMNSCARGSWTLPIYVTSPIKKRKNVQNNSATTTPIVTIESGNCSESTEQEGDMMPIESGNCSESTDQEGDMMPVESSIRNEIEIGQRDEDNVQGTSNNDFLHVGQIFKSKEELKNTIMVLAVRQNFGYKVKTSTPQKYKVLCVDKECKWRVAAAKYDDISNFEIKRLVDRHTCSFDVRSARQCKPSYKIVAEMIKKRFEGDSKGPNPKTIHDDVRREFFQNVSYWKAWKAQEYAQNLIRGTPEDNYAMIPTYCHMLKQVNVGTYTCLELTRSKKFKYVFISIGASITGFNQLRKVIMIGGTHLHNKFEGNLMIATAQDANHQNYPVAYAVVDSENDNSWMWFFQQLLNVIPCSTDLVFVSDLNLSIDKAVKTVYISAKHVICTQHVKENLKSRYKVRGILALFDKAANNYTLSGFHDSFQQICDMSPEIGDYLREVDLQKWSRANCPGKRYNIMRKSNSDIVNSVLEEARSYQIVALLDYIRALLGEWFVEQRELMEKHKNQLPPNISLIVEQRCRESKKYEVKELNSDEFQILGGSFSGVVNLLQKSCSCKVFDLDYIPCTHAIAAIIHMNLHIYDFITEYYQFNSWSATYKDNIYPLPTRTEWVAPQDVAELHCYPPSAKRRIGRPRKRMSNCVEEYTRNVKSNTRTCSSCGKSGHNKTTCMNKASTSSSMG